MKYIIDTEEKEIHVPDGIKLIDLLSLVTVLNSDTEDYSVLFYEEEDDEEDDIFNYIFDMT
jgi:hypothetical protein